MLIRYDMDAGWWDGGSGESWRLSLNWIEMCKEDTGGCFEGT